MEKHPFAVFPPEIWDMILGNVTNSLDFISCYNATKVWREFMEAKRTACMFPEVIGSVAKDLELDDLLNCRLVCSQWKHGIDRYLQSHPTNLELNGPIENVEKCRNWLLGAVPDSVERFLKPELSSSPFFSRSIGLEDVPADPEQSNQFWINARRVLKNHGKKIYYCQLELHCVDGSHEDELYQNMCSGLSLMPNLKMLQLGMSEFYGSIAKTRCFPVLDNLRVFKSLHVPTSILNEILWKCRGIEKLEVLKRETTPFELNRARRSTSNGRDDSHFRMIKLDLMDNLRELSMKYYSKREMLLLESSRWPFLQYLNLTFDFRMHSFNLKHSFSILQRFSPSLRNLVLEFVDKEVNEPTSLKDVQLQFERLERLRLNFDGFTTMDFILPLTSLKHLDVVAARMWSLETVPLIKFEGYYDRMGESNIWDLMGNLTSFRFNIPRHKKVNVATGECSRKMYLYIKNGIKEVAETDERYKLIDYDF